MTDRETQHCMKWARTATVKHLRLCKQHVSKEDIYQTVFLDLMIKICKTHPPLHIKPYWGKTVYLIVLSKLVRKFKTQCKKVPGKIGSNARWNNRVVYVGNELLDARTVHEPLEIDEVPPVELSHKEQVLLQHLLNGKTVRQIAKIYNVTYIAIRQRLYKIRKIFEEYWAEQALR